MFLSEAITFVDVVLEFVYEGTDYLAFELDLIDFSVPMGYKLLGFTKCPL